MAFAPKFEVIDLSSNRVDTQDIVSFYDGDPLLLQIAGYDSPVVILLADRAQGRISDEALQEYEYKKFPDRDGFVVLEPELIDRVKDGLTYYFTVRSYHVIQGNGYWFTRRNGRVENRAAIRNDKEGPPFAPRILEQTSATVEPSGEGVQAVTLKRPVVSAKPMVDPDKGIVLTAITLDGEDVRSQVSEGVLNVQQTGQMQSVSWTYTATNILGDTPSDGMIGVPAYAKPVASNALPDLTFEDESGLQYAQTAQDFTGLYLTYSLQSPVPGVSINEGTGRLTIDLDGAAISSRSVVVVATNGAGSAPSAFTLTVTAPSVDLLEATAERNATDPRLVDYAIAGVPEGYRVRIYVGTEQDGDFDLAEPITEGGTTGSNFAGLTYVWVYLVGQDNPNSPLASGLVATLDPYAPTVAAANVSARRNEAEPERVDMTNGTDGQILPPGYAIEVYVGTDEAGDSGATTVIPEGETIPTSPTHAGLRYVVAFLRDDAGQIVDSELVATLPSIENPTVANANLSAARNAGSPGWVDFVNGADDQLMPSNFSVGFYVGNLPEGDPQFVTVVPEGGTATSGKEFPDADYVVGFIFDGPDGTGNVVDSDLVVQLAAVGGGAVTITQIEEPTVSPAYEGQTARSRYNPGTYSASDGSTVTVAAQMVVNGVDVSDGYILAAGDTLAVRETATAGGVSEPFPVSAAVTVAERVTTITSFADWEAFADEAATTTEARPFVYDEAALASEIGATEPVGGWKVPGVDTEASTSFDSTNRIFTINGSYSGTFRDWDLTDTQLVLQGSPDVIENCQFGDTSLNSVTSSIGANVIFPFGSAVTGGLRFRRISYTRERNWPLAPGQFMFFRTDVESGAVTIEDSYFDGITSDWIRPNAGVSAKRCIVNLRWMDDIAVYSDTVTYNTGDFVISAQGHLWRAKVDNLTGVAPPVEKKKTETRDEDPNWYSYDPHSDVMQATSAVQANTNPADLGSEYTIFKMDGRFTDSQVRMFWVHLQTANEASRRFLTHGFHRCAFLRHPDHNNASIAIEEVLVDIAPPIFSECWFAENNRPYGDVLSVPPLWIGMREAVTGLPIPAPAGFTDDPTLRLETREDVDGFARLTFNRTPIIPSTEGITLSGSSTLVVDKAVVERILARAIRDVADNAYEIDIEIGGDGTVVVEPPEGETDPTPEPAPQTFQVVDEQGNVSPLDPALIRMSLDGGGTWASPDDLGLTLSWDDAANLRISGASLASAADGDVLMHYGHKIPGEPNSAEVTDVWYADFDGAPAPRNATVPGSTISTTNFDFPLKVA